MGWGEGVRWEVQGGGPIVAGGGMAHRGPVSTNRKPQAQPENRIMNTTPRLVAALAALLLLASDARAALTNAAIDLGVLVLAADGNDNTLPAIRKALDFIGTPYTVYAAAQTPGGLTYDRLASGPHSFYSGVILTTGSLGYSPDGGATWSSALSAAEWQTLWQWEADFGLRQVNWYAYPTADYGFGPASATDTSATPLAATFTAAGKAVFAYVNPTNALAIRYAWTYLAPALDTNTTPLLVDAAGNALAAIKSYPDGRQVLTLTFDSNEWLRHNQVLNYGLVNWVSQGLFLGERHIYASAQVDDLFLADDMWFGNEVRMSGPDVKALVTWQNGVRGKALTRNFRLDLAFNGWGAQAGNYANDTLTPAAKANQSQFKWISHTWDHEDLNPIDYAGARLEITNNFNAAAALGLSLFSRKNMVTPNVSGLTNASFLQAAYDSGLRYLVSDTSLPGYDNPTPNAGLYNPFQPAILMIPRHPCNLYYNVASPDEWAGEYNFIYNAYWGRDLTYDEILDDQSELLLGYLLKGDLDPWMFHQPNLVAYDGVHSLLGDLLDRTFAKYASYFNLPVLSPTMDALGVKVANRMNYNASGVKATLNPNKTITLTVTRAAIIPVTGLKVAATATTSNESYGGQNIASIKLAAGQSVTLPLQ